MDLHIFQTMNGNFSLGPISFDVPITRIISGLNLLNVNDPFISCDGESCTGGIMPVTVVESCPPYPDCYMCYKQLEYGRCTSSSLYYTTNVIALILSIIIIYYAFMILAPTLIVLNYSYRVVRWPALKIAAIATAFSVPTVKAQVTDACMTRVLPIIPICDGQVCTFNMGEGCVAKQLTPPESHRDLVICMSPVVDYYAFDAEYDFSWYSNIVANAGDQQFVWVQNKPSLGPRHITKECGTDSSGCKLITESATYLANGVCSRNVLCGMLTSGGINATTTNDASVLGTLYAYSSSSRAYRVCVNTYVSGVFETAYLDTVIDGEIDNIFTEFPPQTIASLDIKKISSADIGDFLEDQSIITHHQAQSNDQTALYGYFSNAIDQTYNGCESLVDVNRSRAHTINTCDDLINGGFISEFIRSIAWPVVDSNTRSYSVKGSVGFACPSGYQYTTTYNTPNIYPIGSNAWTPSGYNPDPPDDRPHFTPMGGLDQDTSASVAMNQCADWGFSLTSNTNPLRLCYVDYMANYYFMATGLYPFLITFDPVAILSWISAPTAPLVGTVGRHPWVTVNGYCYVYDSEIQEYYFSLKFDTSTVGDGLSRQTSIRYISYGCNRNAVFDALERYTSETLAATYLVVNQQPKLLDLVTTCIDTCWKDPKVMTQDGNWNWRKPSLYTTDYDCAVSERPAPTLISSGTHGCYMYPYMRWGHSEDARVSGTIGDITTLSPANIPGTPTAYSLPCIACGSDGRSVMNTIESFDPKDKFQPVDLGIESSITLTVNRITIVRENIDAPTPTIVVTFDPDLGWGPSTENNTDMFVLADCMDFLACSDYVGSPDALSVKIYMLSQGPPPNATYVEFESPSYSQCEYRGTGYEAVHVVNETFYRVDVVAYCGIELASFDFKINANNRCRPSMASCNLRIPNNNYNPGQGTIVIEIPAHQSGCNWYDLACLFGDWSSHWLLIMLYLILIVILIAVIVSVAVCICKACVKTATHND